jgi:hypothetical protein
MDGDPVASIDAVRRMVSAVNAAGGEAVLTELHGRDHNAWDEALGKYDVVRWLVRRRGAAGPPPGPRNPLVDGGKYVIAGTALFALGRWGWRRAGAARKLVNDPDTSSDATASPKTTSAREARDATT